MLKSFIRLSIFAAVFGFLLVVVSSANAQSATSTLVAGDIVMSRSTLNVRAAPARNANLVGRVPRHTFGIVTAGPTQATSSTWYELAWMNNLSGWSDSRYLVKKASSGTALPKIEDPNGGESLILGQNTAIQVSFTQGTPRPITLSLMRSSRILGSLVVATTSPDSYTWEIGKYTTRNGIQTAPTGSRYRIAVTMANIPETIDTSDSSFEIRSPTQNINSTTTPTLSSLAPASGSINTTVTLRGSGFTAFGNTVAFGSTAIPNLSSSNGTSLTFTVPASAPLGAANISVTNANGTSNRMSFTVTNSASVISVSAADDSFTPRNLTVAPGTTVRWTNNGMHPHTVTADNGAFDSGSLAANGTFSFTFTTPGTYAYHCQFHGAAGGVGMSGTIVVNASASGPAISALTPTSGPVNTSVTIQGSGFTASGNTLNFGSLTISNLASTNGTTLVFTVPASAPLGAANVSVMNANGTSNQASYTVTQTTATCTPAVGSAPVITQLSDQASVPGWKVTLIGTGFTSCGNTVHFGSVEIPNLVSSSGITLPFIVPSNVPSGDIMQQDTFGKNRGYVNVSVSNANGASGEMQFFYNGTGGIDPSVVVPGNIITIPITDSQFASSSVTILAGDEVFWVNKGSKIHGVQYNGSSNLCGAGFVVNPGQADACIFDHVGTFGYFDPYNPGMFGTVTVVPKPVTLNPPAQSGSVHVYALGTTGAGDMSLTVNGSSMSTNAKDNKVFLDGQQIAPQSAGNCIPSPITSDNAGRWIPMLFYGSKPLTVGTQACAASIPRGLYYVGSHTLWLTNQNGSSETITFNIPAGAIPDGWSNDSIPPGSLPGEILDSALTPFKILYAAYQQSIMDNTASYDGWGRPDAIQIPANSEADIQLEGSRMKQGVVFDLYDGNQQFLRTLDNVGRNISIENLHTPKEGACPALTQNSNNLTLSPCSQSFHLATDMPAGRYFIRGRNPDGDVSNWLTVNVRNDDPAIANIYGLRIKSGSIENAGMAVAGQRVVIDFYGHGFTPGMKATLTKTSLPWNFCLPDPLTGKIPPACVDNSTRDLATLDTTFISSSHVQLNFVPQSDWYLASVVVTLKDGSRETGIGIGVIAGSDGMQTLAKLIQEEDYSARPISGPVGSTFTFCYSRDVWGLSGDQSFRLDVPTQYQDGYHVVVTGVKEVSAPTGKVCYALKMGPVLTSDPSFVQYYQGAGGGGIHSFPPLLTVAPGFYNITVWRSASGPLNVAIEITH